MYLLSNRVLSLRISVISADTHFIKLGGNGWCSHSSCLISVGIICTVGGDLTVFV